MSSGLDGMNWLSPAWPCDTSVAAVTQPIVFTPSVADPALPCPSPHLLAFRRRVLLGRSTMTPPQTPLCGMVLEVKTSSQWTINDPTATDFSEYQGMHRRVLRRSLRVFIVMQCHRYAFPCCSRLCTDRYVILHTFFSVYCCY